MPHFNAITFATINIAAACYADPSRPLVVINPHGREWVGKNRPAPRPVRWPWGGRWWKPTPDDRVRELVKAGALIASEIDRLLRADEEREGRARIVDKPRVPSPRWVVRITAEAVQDGGRQVYFVAPDADGDAHAVYEVSPAEWTESETCALLFASAEAAGSWRDRVEARCRDVERYLRPEWRHTVDVLEVSFRAK